MLRIVFLLLLSYSHTMALEKCSNVEVQWQCATQATQAQKCTKTLDEAVSLIEHQEALCHHQLRINITLFSPSVKLSSNAIFSNVNFSRVAITSPNGTQVQCKTGAASLTFDGECENSSCLMDIYINNIMFISCGPGTHKAVPAALFFNNYCHQIEISHIQVDRSNGVGMAIVDVVGKVSVNWSNFSRNTFQNGYGGGVHLTITTRSTTKFIHCIFRENQLSLHEQNNTQGGGLYVQYRNKSHDSNLLVQNCSFSHNDAEWGGGLLAMFNDDAHNNTLLIDSTSFVNNCVGLHYNDSIAGAGAAVKIYSNATSNNVLFKDCNFTGNVAPWGGGLWIFSKPALVEDSGHKNFTVYGCLFKNNSGHIGAAVYIFCSSPASSPQRCNAKPVIAQSVFIQNIDLPMPLGSGLSQTPHSIVHIAHFPTFFEQMLKFANNSGTPLHVHETSVTLQNDTILNFTENSGREAGSIILYGSWIAVSDNNTLLFSKNKGTRYGGAIYAHMTEEVYLPYFPHCFIQSTISTDPKSWNVHVIFNQNTVPGKLNAIYATSVLPCVQRSGSSLDDDIRQTFCMWNNWNFGENNCTDQIITSPRNFSSTLQNMPAFPGIPSQHLIYAVDDYGHDINEFYVYASVLHPKSANAYVTDRTLTVYGSINTNVSIQLELEANRRLLMTVNVSLEHCPPGFQFDPLSNSCICEFTHHIYCEYGSHSRWIAYVLAGHCMTYSTIEIKAGVLKKHVVFGQCPFTEGLRSFSNHSHHIPYLPLPLEKNELDTKLCRKLNRTGILCGKCIANFSIDLLSSNFGCYNCSGSFGMWLIYLTAEGIPPLIFFMIVLVLHISLTSGPLNGFIFFSQILSVSVEITLLQAAWLDSSANHETLLDFMVKVYSIWSLDFFRLAQGYYNICLGPHVKVMHVLVLHYVSALYPLCFLVIAYIVIELHARNCRVLVRLWKPLCFMCARFRQVWKARTSIIHAFAAFILLSYVKTARISLLLLTFTSIFVQDSKKIIRVVNYDPTVAYLSSEHVPFWCIAVACLLSFGLVPPVLLTFYQFKFFQKCLYRCKMNGIGLRMFMDAFQGCYKDGKDGGPDRRYFAGIYFIFRLVIFGIFDLADTIPFAYTSLITAFVIFGVITAVVQPYKKPFFTYLDIFFFNLLAMIIALQYLALFLRKETDSLPVCILSLTFTLIFIPFMYVCLFVFYWVFRRAPKCAKQKLQLAFWKTRSYFTCPSVCPTAITRDYYSVLSDHATDSDVPDRIEHSFRYRSL